MSNNLTVVRQAAIFDASSGDDVQQYCIVYRLYVGGCYCELWREPWPGVALCSMNALMLPSTRPSLPG